MKLEEIQASITRKFGVSNITELQDTVQLFQKQGFESFRQGQQPFYFRGQKISSWGLEASIYREDSLAHNVLQRRNIGVTEGVTLNNVIEVELLLLSLFYQRCCSAGLEISQLDKNVADYLLDFPEKHYNSSRVEVGDWLGVFSEVKPLMAVAQHNGLPTRLLDWSTDMHIALYFAVCDVRPDQTEPCAVWVTTGQLNHFFKRRQRGSDQLFPTTLEFLEQPRFKNERMLRQKGLHSSIAILDTKQCDLQDMNMETAIARNLKRAVDDKKHQGQTDELGEMSERLERSGLLWKIEIVPSLAQEIIEYLAFLGYSGSTLFPDMMGAVKSVEETLLFKTY